MSDSLTLVSTDDLLAVLAVVPPCVPMGWHGDGDWTPESLNAKQRLLAAVGRQNPPALTVDGTNRCSACGYEVDRDRWCPCTRGHG